MAKKKELIDETESEIKKLVESNRAIIGTERTIKALQNDKIKAIYLSSNCPDTIRGDIESYSKIADVKVVELKIPNTELGTLCKKPFVISVLSAIKDDSD